jgi:hypothetical protein
MTDSEKKLGRSEIRFIPKLYQHKTYRPYDRSMGSFPSFRPGFGQVALTRTEAEAQAECERLEQFHRSKD